MGCERIPGGFICSRGQRAKPCGVAHCTRPSVALCDFPLKGKKAGQTCDRALCTYHRHTQGDVTRLFVDPKYTTPSLRTIPGEDTVDYCPAHHEAARADRPLNPRADGENPT